MQYVKTIALALVLGVAGAAFAQAPDANTLVVAQSVDASQLDPAAIGSRPEANIAAHLWGTLTTVTRDGEIVPALAESYAFNSEGNEITYRLRSGLTCHDGEALTAEDAAYSFNRAADPANAFTGNTPGYVLPGTGFVEARADSDLDVTIVLERRNPVAPALLGEVYVHCMDSYEAMTADEAANTPVGSGAYRFVEWVRDDRLVMELVDGHPLAVENAFDTIVWRVVPEASTRAAELIAGNVDIVANVSPDQAPTINASGRATVQAVAGTRRIYVGFNFRQELFGDSEGAAAIQNVLVRRAINHAVDVPTICTQLLSALSILKGLCRIRRSTHLLREELTRFLLPFLFGYLNKDIPTCYRIFLNHTYPIISVNTIIRTNVTHFYVLMLHIGHILLNPIG